MSKRFQRWAETWIDDNVLPHANVDIESDEARAKRLTENMLADAAGEGFSKFEMEEERERVLRMVQTTIADRTDFDIGAYTLAWQLAMEHEDGD